jgi:hypothetical protein
MGLQFPNDGSTEIGETTVNRVRSLNISPEISDELHKL